MSVDKKAPYTQLSQDDPAPPAYTEAEASGPAPSRTDFVQLVNRAQAVILAHPTVQFAQPTARPQMNLSGGERNAKGLEIGLDDRRSWNHSLCSFYERPGQTLGALCCPCFAYSANRSRLAHLNATGQPIKSPQHVGLLCALYTISPNFLGIGQVAMQCFSRLQTRQRYSIRGDVVQDALIAGFCVPCSIVQESREIEDEEEALRNGQDGLGETFYRDQEESA